MIRLEVKGLRVLQEQLLQLEAKLASKAIYKAARKAFQSVLDDARARAPVDTGLLKRRIKIQVIKPKRGETLTVVGLRISRSVPRGTPGKNARTWQWFEFGIPSRGIGAQPFLRSSLDSNAEKVLSMFKAELAFEIEEAIKAGAK